MATDFSPRTLPTRRACLSALAGAALGLPVGAATLAAQLLTAWDHAGQSWAGLWRPGQAPRGIALPARAHEVLELPGGQALAVARRPGEFLVRFDVRRARALQWLDMEIDRFLSGHAALAPDGKTLYTTESDADSGAGLVAERDPSSLRKRREFLSGGIGPHALVYEPGGTLLVANGGLLTLPETGRRKLNRDRMDASLAHIDPASGRLLARWRVQDPHLSLRHLAHAADGTVAVALQAEHEDQQARDQAPLLALLDAQRGLRCVPLPPGVALRGYAGDIAWLPAPGPLGQGAAGGSFVLSATHAGQLAWWSSQGDWQGQLPLPQAGALASQGPDWLACGAGGQVQGQLRGTAFRAVAREAVRWDNHARVALAPIR